jgi:hypothetical protein
MMDKRIYKIGSQAIILLENKGSKLNVLYPWFAPNGNTLLPPDDRQFNSGRGNRIRLSDLLPPEFSRPGMPRFWLILISPISTISAASITVDQDQIESRISRTTVAATICVDENPRDPSTTRTTKRSILFFGPGSDPHTSV